MELSNRGITAVGERYRAYGELPGDRKIIQEYRQWRCSGLPGLFLKVAECARKDSCAFGCRIKRTDTIVRKLRRETSMDLVRMVDVIGFRIVVSSLTAQREVIRRLNDALPIERERNYVEHPTEAGYRGVHMVLQQILNRQHGESRYPIEIQVRTHYQNLWATTSESFGEQVKEGGGTDDQRAYLRALASKIKEVEDRAPSQSQLEPVIGEPGVSFFVLNFNKKSGVRSSVDPFGSDVDKAIPYYNYLEDTHTQDLSREIVLLGVPTDQKELQITHMRYFSFLGIAPLPAIITPDHSRP